VREVSWSRGFSKIGGALRLVFVAPSAFEVAPDQWLLVHVPFFGLGLSVLRWLACGTALVVAADAFRRRLLDRAERNWVLVALGHYALLSALLFYLSVRYGFLGKPGLAFLGEASRYMNHILPALAIAWLLVLGRWIHWRWTSGHWPKKGDSPPIVQGDCPLFWARAARASAVGVGLLLGLIVGSLAYRGVKNAMVFALAPPAGPDKASQLVIDDVDRRPDRPHVVFDPHSSPYLIHGRVHHSFPNTADYYLRTANSRTVYVYVVVRSDGGYPAGYTPDSEMLPRLRRYALALAAGLRLARIGEFGKGAIEVYGGYVPPFPAGRLSEILAGSGGMD
jgi:hypothetical protein